ncbi:MAG TPA: CAP domain-containing protein [Candidatus Paceibacterota bacterium]
MKKILFIVAIVGLIIYLRLGLPQVQPGVFWENIRNQITNVSSRFPNEKEITQFFKDKIPTLFSDYWFSASSSTSTLVMPRDVESLLDPLKKIIPQVITPPPIAPQTAEPDLAQTITGLTRVGVIHRTNTERILQGLKSLQENLVLNAAAKAKANDLFARQYFAHVSPIGEGIAIVVTRFGYDYAIVGENLALGRFEDDKALVDAWMASPGHKANILNSRYMEIGVAVVRGIFEGQETWIGVQVFGLPLSACPAPDITLRATIDAKQKLLLELEAQASTTKKQIDAMKPDDPGYREKIDAYNTLVPQINDLISDLDVLIKKYNEGVKLLNGCISLGSYIIFSV